MSWAVKFEGVSKQYRGGGPRYGSLRHDLSQGFKRIGQLFSHNGSEARGKLALDDVSFEVQQGESFAIIGPNGAGKTTALKLLSRISYPTRGRVLARGRVAALIEVGSGIHPELTARENIWLYGRILGMGRSEVRQRFDQIVEFAELVDALDAPVKTFSSGMQLRLGFSISVHLDPDIFAIDEALAVGDAGFQAKCTQLMTNLVKEGKTILFVSHNLPAVEAMCNRGMFLVNGRVGAVGPVRSVLRQYIDWVDDREQRRRSSNRQLVGRGLVVERVTVHDLEGVERYVFTGGEPIEVRFQVWAECALRPWFSLGVTDGRPGTIVLFSMLENKDGFQLSPGRHIIKCQTGPLPLAPRVYDLFADIREGEGVGELVEWSPVGSIRVSLPADPGGPMALTAPWVSGAVRIPNRWVLDG